MRELGQFLAAPGSLFNTPSAGLFVGLVVLCITLLHMVLLFLVPLSWGVPARRILILIPCVAIASLLLVLLTQWAAGWLHEEISQRPLESGRMAIGPGSPRQTVGKFLFLIVAYLIGWGYSRSLDFSLAFDQHVLSFTLGTGVVEEVVKGVAGLVFVGALSLDRNEPSLVTLGRWLAGFTAAGLSFGAGEALFYFQVYAGTDTPLSVYLLRATWCVLLHESWSFLTGLLVLGGMGLVDQLSAKRNPAVGQPQWGEGFVVAGFIGCCLPAALLHGIYDASCIHSAGTMWVVGGVCLGVCLCGLGTCLGGALLYQRPAPVPEQAKPATEGERTCCLVCPCGHEIGIRFRLELREGRSRVGCPRCARVHLVPSTMSPGERYIVPAHPTAP